jgi:uncharacterized protein involved in outer membrane biogenesis
MAPSGETGRRIGKIIAWLVAMIFVLIAALTIFIPTFNWNRARPWVDDKVTRAIGRPFAIKGDLKVAWRHPVGEPGWRGWVPWPRFSATNITVGNPGWTRQLHFATLDEIDFEVEVLPLLAHHIVIPAINLVNPSVDLERLLDGRDNWTFKLPAAADLRNGNWICVTLRFPRAMSHCPTSRRRSRHRSSSIRSLSRFPSARR